MGEIFYKTDHYEFSEGYEHLQKLKKEKGLSELEEKVCSILDLNKKDKLLELLKTDNLLLAYQVLFATKEEHYKAPAGESSDDFEYRHITYYELSEDLRKKALKFLTRIPIDDSETVLDFIFNLPYENYPKHKAGHSNSEKYEIISDIYVNGSERALEYLKKLRP